MNKTILIALTALLAACSGSKDEKDQSNDLQSTDNVEDSIVSDDSDQSQEGTYVVEALGNTMAEIRYDIKEMTVPAETEITIKLINRSEDAAMSHNFVIIESGFGNDVGQAGLKFADQGYVNPNDLHVIAASPLSAPGEEVSFTFTTPERGEYEFVCTFPGHWGLMKGKFIVE